MEEKLQEKYADKDIKPIKLVEDNVEKVKIVKPVAEEKLVHKGQIEAKGDLEEKEKPQKEVIKKKQRERLKPI